jgi:hypothetical protein
LSQTTAAALAASSDAERVDAAGEDAVGGAAAEIADVRAEHESAAGCHGDGVFHLRAHADHRMRQIGGQFQWRRRMAARAAQHDGRAAGCEARDGIIHRPGDGAVVAEEQIRDARKPLAGFVIIGAERFVGQDWRWWRSADACACI